MRLGHASAEKPETQASLGFERERAVHSNIPLNRWLPHNAYPDTGYGANHFVFRFSTSHSLLYGEMNAGS
jgi:hypothetical protein